MPSPTPKRARFSPMKPLQPTARVLTKLGSIAVHAQEFFSPRGHAFDKLALEALLVDPEIEEWLAEMQRLALLPVRRA